MKMRKYKLVGDVEAKYEHNVSNVNMNDIATVIEQTPEKIVTRFEYPSGLIVISTSFVDGTVIETNWTMVKLKDGSYVLAEPYPEME